MNLSFHESVELDLADGVEFYDPQEPGIGEYFQESILADAVELQKEFGFHSKRWDVFENLELFSHLRSTTMLFRIRSSSLRSLICSGSRPGFE